MFSNLLFNHVFLTLIKLSTVAPPGFDLTGRGMLTIVLNV